MKPAEQIAQLEKELATSKERETGLLKRVEELESKQKEQKPSKSRLQAEQTLELLRQGPVTIDQLQKINPKYPSDPIYYVKTILKINVERVKTETGSVYMLAAAAQAYREDQQKKKLVQEAATKDVKEELPQAIPQGATHRTTTAVAATI
jgi:hypothetical protein